tara:strand:- start:54 stop:419 length:366 start_codon:yes stop_codon:yes gene_type:complete
MKREDVSTISFVAHGEPASKSNQRRLVMHKSKPRFIKSAKALSFLKAFSLQVPRCDPLMEGDVSVTMTIYYASRRPDLDESVVLDAMQGYVYQNDRQVKEKHIYWALDKDDPRVEVSVDLR